MHQSSYRKMLAFRETHLAGFAGKPLRIVDLGAMDVNGSYRPIFDDPAWTYQGMDIAAGPNVDVVVSDLYDWRELPDNSCDVFISGQAFEHIEFFWLTMREISRALKVGGLCCLLAPSGGYEHRYPVDCYRFYADGMRALAKYVAFEVLEAATDRTSGDYADDSNVWQDSILVAKKTPESYMPARGLFARLKEAFGQSRA